MSATQTRISHQNLPEQVLIKFTNSHAVGLDAAVTTKILQWFSRSSSFLLCSIYATLEREKKNGYTVAGDGENLHVLEFFAVGNKGKTVLFYSVKGSVRCSIFQYVNLRMQHNSYFAISLYACVTRSATA